MRRIFILGLVVLLAGCSKLDAPPSAEGDALRLANPEIAGIQTTPSGNKNFLNATQQQQQQLQKQLQQQKTMNPQTPTPTSSDTANFPQKPNSETELLPETAKIVTSKGTITVKLFRNEAPNTITNFAAKAQSGYYNNLTFHRVEDWVIQGGDPEGTGRGGGTMPTEINSKPFVKGSLGVARGSNKSISNDSQFFICTTDCNWLTNEYTNFGEVTEGMDVAQSIAIGDKIVEISVAGQ